MGNPADYPVCLQLAAAPVLVVGAGAVALSRVEQLLSVGAQVLVVAPVACQGIQALAQARELRLSLRPFTPSDCAGARLVFAATADEAVNLAVAFEARARGIWVNVADVPALCDFTLPSVGRRGPVTVAVSTSGLAPAMAALLRRRLMEGIGPEHALLVRLFGRLRRLQPAGAKRRQWLRLLAADSKLEALARRDRRSMFAHLRQAWSHRPGALQ